MLGKDVFRALAAVAWADGKLDPEEAEALLRAAKGSGLTGQDFSDVEKLTKEPVRIDELSALDVTPDEAEFAYAIACLMSAADGVIEPSERASITKLGDLLALPWEARDRAASASMAIAQNLGLSGHALEALSAAIEGRA